MIETPTCLENLALRHTTGAPSQEISRYVGSLLHHNAFVHLHHSLRGNKKGVRPYGNVISCIAGSDCYGLPLHGGAQTKSETGGFGRKSLNSVRLGKTFSIGTSPGVLRSPRRRQKDKQLGISSRREGGGVLRLRVLCGGLLRLYRLLNFIRRGVVFMRVVIRCDTLFTFCFPHSPRHSTRRGITHHFA